MKERTLREKIQEESNDYGEIESIFYRRTGEELIKEENQPQFSSHYIMI